MGADELELHLGEVDASPEEVGYDPRYLGYLDTHFRKLIKQERLQCASYLLSRHGKTFACKSMGKLSGVAERGDLQPDSIRRVASITKVFCATAILQLVERGEIYLTQPVVEFLEEFNNPKHNSINIFHLLTHTSGLRPDPGYFYEPYPKGFWDYSGEDSWIKKILAGPPLAKPGQVWMYSSAGYLILGEIIARITGKTAEEYITENILEPLGMSRSYFDLPKELFDQVCQVVMTDWNHLHEQENRLNKPPRTAGGLYSTLYDICKMGDLMLNKGIINGNRILGRKTVELMTKNQLHNVPAESWGVQYDAYEMGLGWRVTHRNIFSSPGTFSHEGAGRSALYIDPVEEFIAVYFVPTKINWVPESIINPQGIIWAGIL